MCDVCLGEMIRMQWVLFWSCCCAGALYERRKEEGRMQKANQLGRGLSFMVQSHDMKLQYPAREGGS
jgi:hypothetical protein